MKRSNHWLKVSILLMVTTFMVTSMTAQKFGKVGKGVVSQLAHPTDSTAEAAYIFKKANVRFAVTPDEIELVLDVHERIKIYDERGEGYGEFNIPLYRDGSDKEKVSGLKALTFNIENGKLVNSKLNKKDVYVEETSENYSYQKFALPDVKAGSVLEIKYTVRSPFKFVIPTFNFQEDVPVDHAMYEVRIPPYFTYTPVAHGVFPIEKTEKSVFGDYEQDIAYTFVAKNVPAMLSDDYVLDIDDYRTSLKYELYSTQFPNRVPQYYVKDWNEVAKDLMDHPYFGKEIGKRTKQLEPIVEGVEGKSDEEKVTALHSYVQDNFSWNGDYGYMKKEGVKDLLKTKIGSVGDINQLLLNLLLQAGVDARPFLIKTRSSGLLNQIFPSRSEMNYLLVYIPKGESYVLLDGTCKYSPVGQLPRRATNINGLLITGDQGSIVNVVNPNNYKSVTMTTYDLDTDMPRLYGDGKRMLKEYAASQYRREVDERQEDEEVVEEDSDDEEEDEEWDEDVNVENEFELVEIKNMEDIDKDISMSYTEVIYNELHKIGDQIFINAAIDFGIDNNPFRENEREYPVFYSSLSDTRQIIKINIPDGYEIESLPARSAMTLEGQKAKFIYSAKQMGQTLVIDYTFKVNTDIFLPSEYPGLKELYDRVIEKSKEKIVLTKKT